MGRVTIKLPRGMGKPTYRLSLSSRSGGASGRVQQ